MEFDHDMADAMLARAQELLLSEEQDCICYALTPARWAQVGEDRSEAERSGYVDDMLCLRISNDIGKMDYLSTYALNVYNIPYFNRFAIGVERRDRDKFERHIRNIRVAYIGWLTEHHRDEGFFNFDAPPCQWLRDRIESEFANVSWE